MIYHHRAVSVPASRCPHPENGEVEAIRKHRPSRDSNDRGHKHLPQPHSEIRRGFLSHAARLYAQFSTNVTTKLLPDSRGARTEALPGGGSV